MRARDAGGRGLNTFPMHIGTNPPSHWDDIEVRQALAGDDAGQYLREQKRPRVAAPGLDWDSFGFDVRWIGDDPADCVVALEPGIYHGHGATEYERFVQGASTRGEVALVVSTIVDSMKADSRGVRSLFSDSAGSDHLSKWNSYVSARYLGERAQVFVSDEIHGADRDLALRLIGEELRWWVLELHGSHISTPGRGEVLYPPQGTLTPLIKSGLGETVVGVWVAPDGIERRYLLPSNVDWSTVADWIAEQALPEIVPSALRRFKSFEHVPAELMTHEEIATSDALTKFEATVDAERQRLKQLTAAARSQADQMRHELLFARAGELVGGVAKVLRSAGVDVIDLDQDLGGTKSADLLCSYGEQRRLVEVKSVGGAASERLYSDLLRHLESWPGMGRNTHLDGGALVINHEHKKHPLERSPMPYERPEFLASQREPVITTRDLFDAWRAGDDQKIRELVFPTAATWRSATIEAKPKLTPTEVSRRWWQRRRSLKSVNDS